MLKFLSVLLLCSFVPIVNVSCGGGDDNSDDGNGNGNGGKPDQSSTTGIDKFSSDNVFSINTYLLDNIAMQGFNFDSDGSIWYTQSSNTKHQLNWIKAKPNKSTPIMTANTEYMKLLYFGHGTNTAVEEVGTDRYLWLGAYATCNDKGQYWTEKIVGRVKYEKGKTVKTDECQEYYYIGDFTDLHPSIDEENDLLTINYNDKNFSQYRCFVVYKLSEAKKAPMTNVTITCSDGFQTGKPASTNIISVPIYCRDLTKLTPVARPKFRKQGYGQAGVTYYDWQGYDVHKDRLYYSEGQSNYNLTGSFFEGVSYAYVTVFDFDGNIVEERTQVAVISDKDKLKEIGVTVFGAMESEGVKVHKGKLYLAYTARGITEQNTNHYQNIFVFKPASK